MTEPLIFDRHRKLPYPEKSLSGRPRCRNCLSEIPVAADKRKQRSSFCSPECGEAALVVSSASYARSRVEERDHGVCARCGMDTEYVKSTLNPLLKEAANRWQEVELAAALRGRVIEVLLELGFSGRVAFGGAGHRWAGTLNTHLWEANHIIPVVHGGGGCGLENLETLCRVCHTKDTGALAGKRAKTKRIVKKRDRHAERMAMKAAGTQLPLSKKWRR